MAASPALDVPPEPPFKRRKTTPEPPLHTETSDDPNSIPLVADLSEQLDAQERKKYIKGKKLGS
ncbi:hypothetical protein KC317_g7698, partial [Hortaea werneckii]